MPTSRRVVAQWMAPTTAQPRKSGLTLLRRSRRQKRTGLSLDFRRLHGRPEKGDRFISLRETKSVPFSLSRHFRTSPTGAGCTCRHWHVTALREQEEVSASGGLWKAWKGPSEKGERHMGHGPPRPRSLAHRARFARPLIVRQRAATHQPETRRPCEERGLTPLRNQPPGAAARQGRLFVEGCLSPRFRRLAGAMRQWPQNPGRPAPSRTLNGDDAM